MTILPRGSRPPAVEAAGGRSPKQRVVVAITLTVGAWIVLPLLVMLSLAA